MVTELKVRELLNKRLRGAVDDDIWAYLQDEGRVQDLQALDGDELAEEVKAVAAVVRSLRRHFPLGSPAGSSEPGRVVPPSGRKSADVGDRSTAFALALSENVAARADRDRVTAEFRRVHLPDGLLTLDQIEAWVAERVQEQPEQKAIARIAVPEGWDGKEPLPSAGASVFVERLAYVAGGYDTVREVVVAPGGVLDRLRRLATGLAISHGWEPSQAATWVLTGVTPLIGLIRITEGAHNVRESNWTAWSERITLDVHPAAGPEEVADAYRAARKRLDARRTEGQYRARSQGIAQLVLARFVARRRAQPTPTPWSTLRAEWNAWIVEQEGYEDLKSYSFDSVFRRDAQVACARVLYRGYYAGRGAATAAANDDMSGLV
ncbi:MULTISPECIES: hypothetical protein [unclassified Amycolatopsis]|uniref:hypothetical protein n=1 Tax=unclassified Amycolatopsis TaxID=2618356 RepID=UPI0028762CDC|nr:MULTISPECIES: hypothetical protein [unclassified Amycolatopsis]MDS0137558.1 hypothetical protein [Amycolatopsis sp. 505]MDS0141753.1 hypothetical protein [Amycolatopsis sp. CM201R]